MKVKNTYLGRILHAYPLSALCVAAIWVLCLMPVPETPLSHVRLIDKWVHFVIFGGLAAIIWVEHALRHRGRSPRQAIKLRATWPYALLGPIVMGALVEIVQATCTGGRRSGDVIDFVADTIGVCLGQLIGIPLARWIATRGRGA